MKVEIDLYTALKLINAENDEAHLIYLRNEGDRRIKATTRFHSYHERSTREI